jgi:transposase
MTGVSYKTQYAMVRRWVERGFKIVSLLCLRGSKVKIDEATREMIASPAMLMAQRHMSLHARAAYWRERLNLPKLSTWLIREIYLEHGASYRKPQVVYKSKNERVEELRHKQKEFSSSITRVLM